jgi:DNA-binding transcriptional MerR regulator
MRIGELAGLVGISTRAIRHYHHVGLLAEPARTANGYREYSLRDAVELAREEADLRRRRARLAQLLRQAEAGGKPSEQAPVSPGLAGLFDRMAHVAAGRPGLSWRPSRRRRGGRSSSRTAISRKRVSARLSTRTSPRPKPPRSAAPSG